MGKKAKNIWLYGEKCQETFSCMMKNAKKHLAVWGKMPRNIWLYGEKCQETFSCMRTRIKVRFLSGSLVPFLFNPQFIYSIIIYAYSVVFLSGSIVQL